MPKIISSAAYDALVAKAELARVNAEDNGKLRAPWNGLAIKTHWVSLAA